MTLVQLMAKIADFLDSCEDRSTFERPAGGALAFAPAEWRSTTAASSFPAVSDEKAAR